MSRHNQTGFTLAELLISLAILGVIATFTIPKVLSSQADQRYRAAAKEAMATVSAAYQVYRLEHTAGLSTTAGVLTEYLNYANIQTSGQVDDIYSFGNWTCSGGSPCYRLHNGGVLVINSSRSFADAKAWAGTSTTDFMDFFFDPDGQVTDGTTNGPGKSLKFFLYADGKIRDWCSAADNNPANDGCVGSPPWFDW